MVGHTVERRTSLRFTAPQNGNFVGNGGRIFTASVSFGANLGSWETGGRAKSRANAALFKRLANRLAEPGLAGWGARIRTWEWRNQNPLPYHLATPQYHSSAFRIAAASNHINEPPHPDVAAILHLAMATAELTPGAGVHHLIGDMHVPNLGHILRLIGIEQRPELARIGHVCPAQAEALGD